MLQKSGKKRSFDVVECLIVIEVTVHGNPKPCLSCELKKVISGLVAFCVVRREEWAGVWGCGAAVL